MQTHYSHEPSESETVFPPSQHARGGGKEQLEYQLAPQGSGVLFFRRLLFPS